MSDAREAGFTLIEVIVCVALVASACVAALAVLPTLVRATQRDLVRDAASGVAQLELERIRAATAYYPASGVTPNHAYALNPSASYATTAHVHRTMCGGNAATTDVPLAVSDTYVAATDTVTITVSYPPDPCRPQTLAQLSISARVPPSLTIPGSTVTVPIGDPAIQ
jgi:prepilin-type N-terminal cleavage/methylation domain-containing protein